MRVSLCKIVFPLLMHTHTHRDVLRRGRFSDLVGILYYSGLRGRMLDGGAGFDSGEAQNE